MINQPQYKKLIGYTAAGLALGCVGLSTVLVANEKPYQQFDKSLEPGRAIWLGTCESCHAYGIAGAPVPMKPAQWQTRLEKPTSALYQNAISGFFGPGDTYMPPKGGN